MKSIILLHTSSIMLLYSSVKVVISFVIIAMQCATFFCVAIIQFKWVVSELEIFSHPKYFMSHLWSMYSSQKIFFPCIMFMSAKDLWQFNYRNTMLVISSPLAGVSSITILGNFWNYHYIFCLWVQIHWSQYSTYLFYMLTFSDFTFVWENHFQNHSVMPVLVDWNFPISYLNLVRLFSVHKQTIVPDNFE